MKFSWAVTRLWFVVNTLATATFTVHKACPTPDRCFTVYASEPHKVAEYRSPNQLHIPLGEGGVWVVSQLP